MSFEPPAIEIRGLCYHYQDAVALQSVSFTIWGGEKVGIIGPNGAGKSTLLLHLNGLLIGQGSVRIHGLEPQKETLPLIRRQVGLVFSDPEDQLFMPTLEQDVAFGPLNMGLSPRLARERARTALETMGLIGLLDRSSHHLSDGERRRAAIASVLSMDPSIWVLDEPGANLDPKGKRELVSILKGLPGTVILASHDLDLVIQICDRCLLLDRGQLVDDGPSQDLLSNARLMERHGLEVPWRLRLKAAGAKEKG